VPPDGACGVIKTHEPRSFFQSKPH
jgi:hypothetical protein